MTVPTGHFYYAAARCTTKRTDTGTTTSGQEPEDGGTFSGSLATRIKVSIASTVNRISSQRGQINE